MESVREVFRVLFPLTYSVVASHHFQSAIPMDSMGPIDWRRSHEFAYFPVVSFSASASFMSKFVARHRINSLQLFIVSSHPVGAYAEMTRLWPMNANQFFRTLTCELSTPLLGELYCDGWLAARKDSDQIDSLHYEAVKGRGLVLSKENRYSCCGHRTTSIQYQSCRMYSITA